MEDWQDISEDLEDRQKDMREKLTSFGGAVGHQCWLLLEAGLKLQILAMLVEEYICAPKVGTCEDETSS